MRVLFPKMKYEEFMQCLKDERFLALTVLVCNNCYFEVTQKHNLMSKTIGFKPHKGDIIKLEKKVKSSSNQVGKDIAIINPNPTEGNKPLNTKISFLEREHETVMFENSPYHHVYKLDGEEADEDDEALLEEESEKASELNAYLKEDATTAVPPTEATTQKPLYSFAKQRKQSDDISLQKYHFSSQAITEPKSSYRLMSGKRGFSKKKLQFDSIRELRPVFSEKRSIPEIPRPASQLLHRQAYQDQKGRSLLHSARPAQSGYQITRVKSSNGLLNRNTPLSGPFEDVAHPTHSKRLQQITHRPRNTNKFSE